MGRRNRDPSLCSLQIVLEKILRAIVIRMDSLQNLPLLNEDSLKAGILSIKKCLKREEKKTSLGSHFKVLNEERFV